MSEPDIGEISDLAGDVFLGMEKICHELIYLRTGGNAAPAPVVMNWILETSKSMGMLATLAEQYKEGEVLDATR